MLDRNKIPDLQKPILFTMPEVTGDQEFILDKGFAFVADKAGEKVAYPDSLAEYLFSSGMWVFSQYLGRIEEQEVVNEASDQDNCHGAACTAPQGGGAITSDGRSSTYYDIAIPDWLVSKILARYEEGKSYIKTEELIEAAFNDDFDAGNAFKSLVRLWGAFNGAGKAGNSVSYEKNKIVYSVGKLEQRFERLGEQ